jgi:hypothetical protein
MSQRDIDRPTDDDLRAKVFRDREHSGSPLRKNGARDALAASDR